MKGWWGCWIVSPRVVMGSLACVRWKDRSLWGMMRAMLECETLEDVNLMTMQSPGYVHGGSTGGMDGRIGRRGGQGTTGPAGPELASLLWAPSTETHRSAPCFPWGCGNCGVWHGLGLHLPLTSRVTLYKALNLSELQLLYFKLG